MQEMNMLEIKLEEAEKREKILRMTLEGLSVPSKIAMNSAKDFDMVIVRIAKRALDQAYGKNHSPK